MEELITNVNALQCSATSPNKSSPATLKDSVADHHATSSTRSPDPVPATVLTMIIPDFPPHARENESFVPNQMPYYSRPALDVPPCRIGCAPHWMCKQIQTGQFFDLAKLLAHEFPSTADEDAMMVLTMEGPICPSFTMPTKPIGAL
ncbi:Hypothetical predicted protein, partial [Paramuricea clavata]